ncbi:MAG: c-type cytochrome [Gammaproteobacteria bacterium]|nr:c-type cytochrome [Gammaproteobacteria bacterium]
MTLKRILLPLLSVLFCAPALADADDGSLSAASGAELYGRLCASCHGPAGRGDGPVAAALKVAVPDLARLGGGAGFPADRVRDVIDGRAVISAHGTRTMPVWGYELEARVPQDMPGRATATQMAERLLRHVESLQAE